MNSLINEETALIKVNGLKLSIGHANVRTVRSMFDTKIAQILSGAGDTVTRTKISSTGF